MNGLGQQQLLFIKTMGYRMQQDTAPFRQPDSNICVGHARKEERIKKAEERRNKKNEEEERRTN
jgi:hypothetical protein